MHCFIDSLNEEEFGEASENLTYDENTTTAAMNLGLLVSNYPADGISRASCFQFYV